jgi:hypothetical protein
MYQLQGVMPNVIFNYYTVWCQKYQMLQLTVTQFDAQNAECSRNMTAVMQTQFKLRSSAYHSGHQILAPKN